jgi:hypothetical protein
MTSSTANLWTNAVVAVAKDHVKNPAAMTQFTSNLSTAQPDTIWNKV